MHFSDILKLQFGKKRHTLLCIFLFFRIIFAQLSLKKKKEKYVVNSIFFLHFNSPCQDLLSPHMQKPHRNTSLLVGTGVGEGN